jgi:hypothetical protein
LATTEAATVKLKMKVAASSCTPERLLKEIPKIESGGALEQQTAFDEEGHQKFGIFHAIYHVIV